MIKAILFDMDGVLIDSEELMRECTKKALAEFGAIVSDDDLRELMGTGDEVYIGGAAERQGVRYVPEMRERVYEVYGENITSAYQCPGAGEAIRFVKEHGLGCAICTSATPGKLVHRSARARVQGERFRRCTDGCRRPAGEAFSVCVSRGREKARSADRGLRRVRRHDKRRQGGTFFRRFYGGGRNYLCRGGFSGGGAEAGRVYPRDRRASGVFRFAFSGAVREIIVADRSQA